MSNFQMSNVEKLFGETGLKSEYLIDLIRIINEKVWANEAFLNEHRILPTDWVINYPSENIRALSPEAVKGRHTANTPIAKLADLTKSRDAVIPLPTPTVTPTVTAKGKDKAKKSETLIPDGVQIPIIEAKPKDPIATLLSDAETFLSGIKAFVKIGTNFATWEAQQTKILVLWTRYNELSVLGKSDPKNYEKCRKVIDSIDTVFDGMPIPPNGSDLKNLPEPPKAGKGNKKSKLPEPPTATPWGWKYVPETVAEVDAIGFTGDEELNPILDRIAYATAIDGEDEDDVQAAADEAAGYFMAATTDDQKQFAYSNTDGFVRGRKKGDSLMTAYLNFIREEEGQEYDFTLHLPF